MAVEGKVSESFGPTLAEWDRDGSAGRRRRWSFLCGELGVGESQLGELRYQLFHRAASALIAARQVRARLALVVVHSFSDRDAGFDDFRNWTSIFGQKPNVGEIAVLRSHPDLTLYGGWVRGDPKFLAM